MSRLHTTSVANIAALTRGVTQAPANRILNIADPSAPSVAESRRPSHSTWGTRVKLWKCREKTTRRRLAVPHTPCRAPLFSMFAQPGMSGAKREWGSSNRAHSLKLRHQAQPNAFQCVSSLGV
jgi:hypothetical protein